MAARAIGRATVRAVTKKKLTPQRAPLVLVLEFDSFFVIFKKMMHFFVVCRLSVPNMQYYARNFVADLQPLN